MYGNFESPVVRGVFTKLKTVFNLHWPPSFFLVVAYIVIAIIKLFLVSDQGLFSYYGPHDDLLYLRHAESILNGQWLGDYNNLTLAKGVGYPLWIALSNLLSVDLLLAQHILYILACFLFVLAISPSLSSNRWRIVLFMLLVFNPISYADTVGNRVIRDGIYPALVLMVFSLIILIHSAISRYQRKPIFLSLSLGLSFFFFWVTREEGIWLLPAILVLISGLLMLQVKAFRVRFFIFVVVIPVVQVFLLISSLMYLNYKHYGVYVHNDVKSGSFVSAYSALQRLKTEDVNRLELPAHTRGVLYDLSPSFAQLKDTLDDSRKWWFTGKEDIHNGMFIWGFRDAVKERGYYADAYTSEMFYRRITEEINSACLQNVALCRERRETLSPSLRSMSLNDLTAQFIDAAYFLLRFDGFKAKSSVYSLSNKAQLFFIEMTGERVSHSGAPDTVQHDIMNGIKSFYSFFLSLGTVLSVGIWVYILSRGAINNEFSLVVATTLLVTGLRLGLVSVMHIVSFNTISVLYIASAYPFAIAFCVLTPALALSVLTRAEGGKV